MYKIYLKQAWALIRQERLFSSVYIVGTGLAISLVMVLSIVFYVKMASIYPEMDRDRLLTVKSATLKNEKGGTSSSPVSPRFVEECLAGVPGLEALALRYDDATSAFVQPVGSPVQVPVMKMGVNDGFWKVFSFRFLEGKPFTEADFRSGMPVAVIARSLAKRLYGEGSAVGQTLSLDFTSFRVVGVVDDVSFLMDRVFSQVLIENFLYTLLGGLVGLLFSFLLVTFASSWVFKIGKGFSEAAPDGVDVSLSMGMLLNPWVFLIALCVCFLLNLMSALWPAWRASRRPIVDSLNA